MLLKKTIELALLESYFDPPVISDRHPPKPISQPVTPKQTKREIGQLIFLVKTIRNMAYQKKRAAMWHYLEKLMEFNFPASCEVARFLLEDPKIDLKVRPSPEALWILFNNKMPKNYLDGALAEIFADIVVPLETVETLSVSDWAAFLDIPFPALNQFVKKHEWGIPAMPSFKTIRNKNTLKIQCSYEDMLKIKISQFGDNEFILTAPSLSKSPNGQRRLI